MEIDPGYLCRTAAAQAGGYDHHGRHSRCAAANLDRKAGDGFAGSRSHRESLGRRQGQGLSGIRESRPMERTPRQFAATVAEIGPRASSRYGLRQGSGIHGGAKDEPVLGSEGIRTVHSHQCPH